MEYSPDQVIIVGHPQCGSAYMAELFTNYGCAVGHDQWNQYGISSWFLSVDPDDLKNLKATYTPQGLTRPTNFTPQHIVHHVRNPYYALPAILEEDRYRDSYYFRKRILYNKYNVNLDSYSPLDRTAISFLLWNKLIDEQQPEFVVRIEDATQVIPHYIKDYLGLKIQSGTKKCTAPQVAGNIDWSLLRPDILQTLDNWCFEYGYTELSMQIKEGPKEITIPIDTPKSLLPPLFNPRDMFKQQHGIRNRIQSRRAPSMGARRPNSDTVSVHTSQYTVNPGTILGPRQRSNVSTTPFKSTSVPEVGGVSIQPRLVHNVSTAPQPSAATPRRSRQLGGGFVVRPK